MMAASNSALMNSSIWKRLYTTLIIFLAVILVACGLAWWGVHTSNRTRQVSEQLSSETVRLRYFATVISDSLRTMLLSPRETPRPAAGKEARPGRPSPT